MKWFKRKKKKGKCKHYREPGEPRLDNMVEIVRFSPYEKDKLGYGVHECNQCGARAFSCVGLHLMGERTCEAIDAFIERRIEWCELEEVLCEQMAWYRGYGRSEQ